MKVAWLGLLQAHLCRVYKGVLCSQGRSCFYTRSRKWHTEVPYTSLIHLRLNHRHGCYCYDCCCLLTGVRHCYRERCWSAFPCTKNQCPHHQTSDDGGGGLCALVWTRSSLWSEACAMSSTRWSNPMGGYTAARACFHNAPITLWLWFHLGFTGKLCRCCSSSAKRSIVCRVHHIRHVYFDVQCTECTAEVDNTR